MAQVARIVAHSAVPAAVGNSRSTVGSRSVASTREGPIDELSASLGASLDAAGRYLEDFDQSFSENPNRGDDREQPLPFRAGRVQLPVARVNTGSSQSFANVLESEQPARVSNLVAHDAPSSFVRGPSYLAINQYEFNARVIAGTDSDRGGTLNLKL
jgi:hypothetical protein